ncbi:MAG TPA: DUF885 family protein, partial [Vicinamibacterales bacterium]|nr:DUF885 family protein [Vicinamibacterales bacterium]
MDRAKEGMRAAVFCLLLLSASALRGAELSAEDLDRRRKALRDLLAAFSEQERLNRELMVRDLRESLEAARFNWWQMPVSQFEGIHIYAPELPSSLVFRTVKDYDDYVARLGRFPKVIDDTIANMRKGMAAKLMPPKSLLEKVAEQAYDIANAAGDQSPFAVPLTKFPATFSESEKQRIRGAVLREIERSIVPAYLRFAAFVRDEYAPHGRTVPGLWALPDGKARYAFLVRQQTTSDLTPAEIHEIGLREAARIEGEMLRIAKSLGHDDLKSFNAAIERNAGLKYEAPQQILDDYRRFIDRMYARLPR